MAVDRYGDHIVVQEYAAPKNIDENKARQPVSYTHLDVYKRQPLNPAINNHLFFI